MKRKIVMVDVYVSEKKLLCDIAILRDGWKWKSYPLTERNYWRAVGMQLRLAGFAKQADPVCVCGHLRSSHAGISMACGYYEEVGRHTVTEMCSCDAFDAKDGEL